MTVRVQTEDFDLSTEIAQLRMHTRKVGAVVTFIGTVRDLNEGEYVAEMELEHYPGMTEKALQDIIDQAKSRWNIFDALVIHRVGPMKPLDQIVLVAVTSALPQNPSTLLEERTDTVRCALGRCARVGR